MARNIVPLILEGTIVIRSTEVRPSEDGRWRLALLCEMRDKKGSRHLSRGPFPTQEQAAAAKDELLSQCAQRRH